MILSWRVLTQLVRSSSTSYIFASANSTFGSCATEASQQGLFKTSKRVVFGYRIARTFDFRQQLSSEKYSL